MSTDTDPFDDIAETIGILTDRAAEARRTAAGLRDSANHHDGLAAGFEQAADMLRRIELPQ